MLDVLRAREMEEGDVAHARSWKAAVEQVGRVVDERHRVRVVEGPAAADHAAPKPSAVLGDELGEGRDGRPVAADDQGGHAYAGVVVRLSKMPTRDALNRPTAGKYSIFQK